MTTDDRLRIALTAARRAACKLRDEGNVRTCFDAALATLDELAALRVGQRVRDPAGNVGVVGASMSHIVRVEYHDGGSTAWGEHSLVPLPDAPAIDTSVSVGDRFERVDPLRDPVCITAIVREIGGPLGSRVEYESNGVHPSASALRKSRCGSSCEYIRDEILAGRWRRLPRETVAAAAHADAPPPRATDVRQVSDALERERDAAIARCEALTAERDAVQFGRTADSAAYAAKLGERTKERDAAIATLRTYAETYTRQTADATARAEKAERERDEARAESEGRRKALFAVGEERRVEWQRAENAEAERDEARTQAAEATTACNESMEARRRAELSHERGVVHTARELNEAVRERDEQLRVAKSELVAVKAELRRQIEAMRTERDSLRAQLAARPTHAWSDAEVERIAREAYEQAWRPAVDAAIATLGYDALGELLRRPIVAFTRHILAHATPPRASAAVDVEALVVSTQAVARFLITPAETRKIVEHVRDAVLSAQAPAVERLIELACRVNDINPESLITELRAAIAEFDGVK